ncbi:kinase phosphorylation protein-domain-containing protein [Lactifluus volemus]|nr:kinase phosphorylation protein-domain-containing protein [Lactifluus volemus]
MYEPIRGGTRGGQAEFTWSDVSADKDRENYLGHSINAPTGRWQKNKDIHWYNRDTNSSEEGRAEEIRKIKEAEAEALSVALCAFSHYTLPSPQDSFHPYSGFGPSKKDPQSSGQGTGTNAIPIPVPSAAGVDVNPDAAVRAADRAERRLRKAQRREEKAVRKAEKAARKEQRSARGGRHHDRSPSLSRTPVRRRRDSRSPSPKRYHSYDAADRDEHRDNGYRRSRDHHSPVGSRFRERSRSPHRREPESHSVRRPRPPQHSDDDGEHERERAGDRQRWGHGVRR